MLAASSTETPNLTVDDPGTSKDSPTDTSTNNSLGHQGDKITGGIDPKLRVLYCTNLDLSLDYEWNGIWDSGQRPGAGTGEVIQRHKKRKIKVIVEERKSLENL